MNMVVHSCLIAHPFLVTPVATLVSSHLVAHDARTQRRSVHGCMHAQHKKRVGGGSGGISGSGGGRIGSTDEAAGFLGRKGSGLSVQGTAA